MGSNLINRVCGLLGECVAGVHGHIGKDAPAEDVLEAVAAARVIAISLAEKGPVDQLITRYPDNAAPISPRLSAPKLPIINILTAATSAQNCDEDDGGRPFDTQWVARVVYALAAATFNLIPCIDQGQAIAALTGAVIRHFGAKCPEVKIAIGRTLGAWQEGTDPAQAPTLVGLTVDELFRRLGMPTRLRDLNVGLEQLSDILRLSLKSINADRERSFVNNQDLLGAVLREAW